MKSLFQSYLMCLYICYLPASILSDYIALLDLLVEL